MYVCNYKFLHFTQVVRLEFSASYGMTIACLASDFNPESCKYGNMLQFMIIRRRGQGKKNVWREKIQSLDGWGILVINVNLTLHLVESGSNTLTYEPQTSRMQSERSTTELHAREMPTND